MKKQKEITRLLDKLLDDIREKEHECFRQMQYCKEHNFEMEREAIRYRQQAYSDSWLMASSIISDIKELIKEK